MKRVICFLCVGLLMLASGCISLGKRVNISSDDSLLAYSTSNKLINDDSVLSVNDIFESDENRKIKENALLKGKMAFDEGRYDEAIVWWEKILSFDPKNTEIALLIKTAEEMQRLKKEQDEIVRLNQLEEAKSKDLKNKVNILKISLSEAQAKKEAGKYLLRGLEYCYKQQYNKALLVFKKGLLLDPYSEKLKSAIEKVKKRLTKISKKESIDEVWQQKAEKLRLEKEEAKKQQLEKKKENKKKREEDAAAYVKEKLDEEFVFELFPEELTKGMKEEFLMEKSVEIYKKAIEQFPLSSLAGRALYKIANHNFQKGEYVLAKEQYDKIVKDYFDSGYAEQSKLKSAQIDAIQNNLEDAIYNTYNFIDTFPNSEKKMEAYMLLGKFFERQGNFDKAKKVYAEIEDFVKDKEKLSQVYFQLADLYLAQDDLVRAKDEYTRIMEINNANKDFDKAQFLRANCLLKQGDFENAAIEYMKIVRSYEMNPYVFESYKKLADIYKQDKDYLKATNMYAQIIKKFPHQEQLKDIYLLRANTFKEAQFYPKAIDSFLSIIQFYPKDKQANLDLLFEIGMCFLQSNQAEEATQYFSQIIYSEEASDSLKFKANWENAKIAFDREKYEEALVLYEQLATLDENSKFIKEILYKTAECYKYLGDVGKSIDYYAKIYSTDYLQDEKEMVFEALLKSADCNFNEEKYDEALKLYDRLIKEFSEHKEDVWSLYQKGKCYDKLNLIPEAISVYEEVVKKYKENYLAQQAIWDIKNLNWISTDKKTLEEKILN